MSLISEHNAVVDEFVKQCHTFLKQDRLAYDVQFIGSSRIVLDSIKSKTRLAELKLSIIDDPLQIWRRCVE